MLRLTNIAFQYQNGTERFNVHLPEVRFSSHVITCVLGRNGSGKTTILNLIGGHLRPEKGNIELDGIDITRLKAELRPTATVFQQIGLFPHLTVAENIALAIEPNTLFKKKPTTREKTSRLLTEFGLEKFAHRKPGMLSVGQQQRVAIARALSSEPQVLLLDEPTSALDYVNISLLKQLLNEIKGRNSVKILVIVSHDLPFVLSVADNIKYIEDGKISFDGDKAAFLASDYYIN